jgi:hypothetical protein
MYYSGAEKTTLNFWKASCYAKCMIEELLVQHDFKTAASTSTVANTDTISW